MEGLREVLVKATELADLLANKLSKIDAEKAAVLKEKAFFESEKKRLSSIADDLVLREEKVKRIEDAKELLEKNAKILEGIQGERAAFGLEKEAFEKFRSDETAKISDQRDILKHKEASLENDRKKLNQDYTDYKKRVIEEVTKELKNK